MVDLSLQQFSSGSRMSSGSGGALSFSLLSIGLLIAVLITTGSLVLLNRSRDEQKAQFIEQNKIKEESLRPELLNQIIALEQRLRNTRGLLVRHTFVSNILRVLEADTHPQVRFSNFSFSQEGLKADLLGEAASYRVLARQIGIFEQDKQIQKIDFGGLSTIGEGLVGFKLTLIFLPSLLQLHPAGVATSSPEAWPSPAIDSGSK